MGKLPLMYWLKAMWGFVLDTANTVPQLLNGLKIGTVTYTAAQLNLALGNGLTGGVTTGITAGTTQTQAGATALTTGVNIIATCANADDGVKLAAAANGKVQIVINKGANAAKVYPDTGDTIDGGSANAAITIPPGGIYIFRADGTTNWIVSKAPLDFDWGIGTLDGSNPTPVTHRLNQIVALFVQQIGDTAPGDDPVYLTTKITSNVGNVYAWKNTGGTDPTLVASTNNSATFFWVALGY